ncbi:sugar isomerase [bacterium]|nr:sugar isomerase [bacterium]
MRVQPVLTYDVPQPRKQTSWRNWGGIQTEAQAAAEKAWITEELARLKQRADFPVEILPVEAARTLEQADNLRKTSYDAVLIYAAGGDGRILERLVTPERWNLMFLRHDPGPVYLWYEIVHPRFLRKTVDDYGQPGMHVEDVVVDKHEEVLWRLRALQGLKNTLGKRMVCIGGAGGWGDGGQKAPDISRNLWKMDLVDCTYKDLEPRIKKARADAGLVSRCEESARRYLKEARVSLHTDRVAVNNAFVLTEVMKDLMEEAQTDAITIQHCMGTIMGISETTACLPLSLLNDEGYLAFCESDFVVIPSGVLLHYISGKPVFLNDPTFPHEDIVTLAHCTAPRKMDGKKAERTKIYTHFESDYGAAPKVEMKLGQVCTNLVPDFNCKKWVGFEGVIVGNPFLDICRSQVDVKIKGNSAALLEEMKGFHWMMSYGDYLKETGYALKKLGVEMHNVSAPALPS